MLWNSVVDFFIKYIFGGITSDGTIYNAFYSPLLKSDLSIEMNLDSRSTILDGSLFGYSTYYLPVGNYLSFIATIITMIVILVLCAQLIKKIYNICAHVIA